MSIEHSYGKKMAVNLETIYAAATSATNVATLQPSSKSDLPNVWPFALICFNSADASALMEFKDVRKRFDPNLFRSIYDNITKHSIDDLVPQHESETPTTAIIFTYSYFIWPFLLETTTNKPYEENKGTQRHNISLSFISFVIIIMLLLR